MEPAESTRIVKFSEGGELTSEEAESGQFVFATTESEPGVTYAFNVGDAGQEEERWAAERGLSEALKDARAAIAELPDDLSMGSGEDAQRTHAEAIIAVGEITTGLIDLLSRQQEERRVAERDLADAVRNARRLIADAEDDVRTEVTDIIRVAEITSRLIELSTKDGVPAIGTPEFLQRAHDERVFDSAIVFEQLAFRSPPVRGVDVDVPDLRRYCNWPNGARSVECLGYRTVSLYELPFYGPSKDRPKHRAYGRCRVEFPLGIRSIAFSP